MTTFKIKKKYIVGLGNWLGSISLQGKQSRMRTRFVSLLEEALERYEKDRKAMLEEVCVKDEEGKPKLIEENGQSHYDIPDDKTEQFNADMKEMGEEDAELTGPETAPVFVTVSNILLNYDGKIEGRDAYAYDKWCEAAEAYLNTTKE